MHTELRNEQPSFAPPRQKHPRSMTWKNPHSHPVSKKGHVDPLEKALTDSRKKNKKLDHVDQSTLEKSSQPLQCKYWVTGNCVHGDKCKYVHSWFCGSGFTMLAKLEGHTEAITGISLPSGSNKLYSVGKDRSVRVWDCSSGQCAGSAVWDLQNMQCLHTLAGHTNAVKSLLGWDCYLLSASLDNTLKVWATTENGTIEVVYEIKEDHGVNTLCSIHDAEARPILLCSFGDNTVRLYDLPNFTERGRIFSKGEVEVIKIGIEGLIFIGDATGEISVWKLLGAPSSTAS